MKKIACVLFLLIKLSTIAKGDSVEFTEGDKKLMNKLVQDWFECYDKWDLNKLKTLYSNDVIYYGKHISKEQCINEKLKFFNPNTTFSQKLISEINYEKTANGVIVARFIKRAGFKGKLQNYPSYFLLYKQYFGYLIFGEGDDISDKKLNFKLNVDEIATPKNSSMEIKNEATEQTLSVFKWVLVIAVSALVIVLLIKRNSGKNRGKEKEELVSQNEIKENGLKTSEENEVKGKQFEDFIVTKFDTDYFTLMEWRSDKYKDGIYAQANKRPDLEYEFSLNNKTHKLAVECKYRTKIYEDVIIAKQYKVEEYKKYSKENNIPVFVVLGIAGEPSNPKECYIIPIKEMKSGIIKYANLKKYRRYKADSKFFFKADLSHLS